MPPSFGTNLPQTVTHIWQKAFFKHALEEQLGGIRNVARHIDNLSKVSEEMEQEMTKLCQNQTARK